MEVHALTSESLLLCAFIFASLQSHMASCLFAFRLCACIMPSSTAPTTQAQLIYLRVHVKVSWSFSTILNLLRTESASSIRRLTLHAATHLWPTACSAKKLTLKAFY
ncbi:hypothetical protein FB567DRAFT_217019 [Paraphoma chrysanthemicola]|uniref:Uncharacterized protein n=1 Tax=Paraphoma chrysanthemicola TaxID=798071 RepID=A0A8K0QV81_9PLEO|nr:hypothetical protein FB567DRAFT_217019 [Paraphoma chrysanthemicola]